MRMNMPADERETLLKLYGHLRVADVRDGLDWIMLHRQGSMSCDIRPLFRTRVCGIARTVRYVPYKGKVPKMSPKDYTAWCNDYYNNICTYPWMNEIVKGDFIVIDQSGTDVGLMGSCNALEGFRNGACAYVTNGGVRDTDELILEKIPFWSKIISQPMTQGRIRFDAKDIPVKVGGVVVHPGDIVVADGDGVVVVPRKGAFDVAKWADEQLRTDKATRRKLYEDLGRELDNTVI